MIEEIKQLKASLESVKNNLKNGKNEISRMEERINQENPQELSRLRFFINKWKKLNKHGRKEIKCIKEVLDILKK